MMPDMTQGHDAWVLGLDVGGTKCAALVGNRAGEVLARSQWPSDAPRGPEAMIDDLVAHGRALMAEHAGVESVGVSIGGPLDMQRGIVLGPPNLPGWENVPLAARLRETFGLPVRVMHDAAACALAELTFGLGRDLPPDPTLAYLTCGTGFGAGLIVQGRVFRGAGGHAPEFGHVQLDHVGPGGPTAFDQPGSAEALCSGPGLSRIAAWQYPQRWQASLPPPEALVKLASQGDVDARRVIDRHAQYTGKACAILIDLLRPHAIVLGSLARYLPGEWLARVRETAAASALPEAIEHCRIEPSKLGDRLQDLSALVAGFEHD